MSSTLQEKPGEKIVIKCNQFAILNTYTFSYLFVCSSHLDVLPSLLQQFHVLFDVIGGGVLTFADETLPVSDRLPHFWIRGIQLLIQVLQKNNNKSNFSYIWSLFD